MIRQIPICRTMIKAKLQRSLAFAVIIGESADEGGAQGGGPAPEAGLRKMSPQSISKDAPISARLFAR